MTTNPNDLQAWAICIDERCHREELHSPHQIVDTEADIRWRGWRTDPLEPPARSGKHVVVPKVRGLDALDETILDAVQRLEVRSFAQLRYEVDNTYGSCCPRRLHRRLARLIISGHVVAIEPFGMRTMRVYVRAGSPLAACPDELLDQVDCAQAFAAEAC